MDYFFSLRSPRWRARYRELWPSCVSVARCVSKPTFTLKLLSVKRTKYVKDELLFYELLEFFFLKVIREDIIRSLWARCDMHCDSLVGDEQRGKPHGKWYTRGAKRSLYYFWLSLKKWFQWGLFYTSHRAESWLRCPSAPCPYRITFFLERGRLILWRRWPTYWIWELSWKAIFR